MKRNLLLAVLLLICSVVAVPAAEQDEFRAMIDKDGVQRVTVVGGDFYFHPSHIVVKVNVPVELTVTKDTLIVPHDINVHAPEAGIDFKVELSREPQVIRFTPTKTGRYPMYCDKKFLFFPSHREEGMEGVIEVVE
ncbi:hypothetical protein GURASL_14000 [Geotalea uraniireducens]|uniref:Quinol oxidase n=1 Tax=Geotalea uraniireducens TaxID=351604 RepID=A0ABM8EJ13_9BACT|nr:quinol oxidase [Geotalea uraniireducens]BDV42477.1 hypothetical protein GURASL_14000 [Geotalea uraniireducens]